MNKYLLAFGFLALSAFSVEAMEPSINLGSFLKKYKRFSIPSIDLRYLNKSDQYSYQGNEVALRKAQSDDDASFANLLLEFSALAELENLKIDGTIKLHGFIYNDCGFRIVTEKLKGKPLSEVKEYDQSTAEMVEKIINSLHEKNITFSNLSKDSFQFVEGESGAIKLVDVSGFVVSEKREEEAK